MQICDHYQSSNGGIEKRDSVRNKAGKNCVTSKGVQAPTTRVSSSRFSAGHQRQNTVSGVTTGQLAPTRPDTPQQPRPSPQPLCTARHVTPPLYWQARSSVQFSYQSTAIRSSFKLVPPKIIVLKRPWPRWSLHSHRKPISETERHLLAPSKNTTASHNSIPGEIMRSTDNGDSIARDGLLFSLEVRDRRYVQYRHI